MRRRPARARGPASADEVPGPDDGVDHEVAVVGLPPAHRSGRASDRVVQVDHADAEPPVVEQLQVEPDREG
jgi:hypothetical protein